MRPPTLLSLAIESAHRHIAHITDLSAVPDPILLELFLKILNAGKLTEKVLKLFMATGNEEILSIIRSLNIQHDLFPVLPTRKYIVSIDDDCFPARDNKGHMVDAVAQHITNLRTPATPFLLNTLYDPYRLGADFVRGYPFGLRGGVPCMLSCGLWLNLPDYDSPTQVAKSMERNCRYVDAVITVPARVMMPISGINVAFNREVLGPALFPGFQLTGEGKQRCESLEDIWSGMCAKVVCDHLKYGVKSGLPYVKRDDSINGSTTESLNREWEGAKLMEEAVPFFQSVSLSATAVLAEDCILELAGKVRQQLGRVDTIFSKAADAMEQWVKLWKSAASQA